MKKRVLLIGGNYFPEPTGIGKYNGEMMNWLGEQGHDCTVITTFPYYPHWKIQKPYEKRCFWFKTESVEVGNANSIKVIRCPHYVPSRPTGVTRLISEFSFFLSAYIVMLFLLFQRKFDYVMTVAPPFEMGMLGIFYKKIRGGKFIYHVQDLQIDAARDLVMVKSKLMIELFFIVERYILKKADFISTISDGMAKKVKMKCHRKIILFPNWVNADVFCPASDRDLLKQKFGFCSSHKVVLYSGAIGKKQGLEAILHSAKMMEKNLDIKFAICGSGPYKEELIKMKNELCLTNLDFLPLQDISEFNSFLNIADVHIVMQKAGAGDLVLPSKLSTILSVGGVAIVTASKGTSLFEIMTGKNMGVVIDPEDQDALTNAISTSLAIDLSEKSRNARQYAEENLAEQKILSQFFDVIFQLKTVGTVASFAKPVAVV